jgi:hypothetical protein
MNDESMIAVLHHGTIEYLHDSRLFLVTSIYQPEPILFQLPSDALKWLDNLELNAQRKTIPF